MKQNNTTEHVLTEYFMRLMDMMQVPVTDRDRQVSALVTLAGKRMGLYLAEKYGIKDIYSPQMVFEALAKAIDEISEILFEECGEKLQIGELEELRNLVMKKLE